MRQRCHAPCPYCGRTCLQGIQARMLGPVLGHTTVLGGGRIDKRHLCTSGHRW